MGISYDIKSILKHLEHEIDTRGCVCSRGDRLGCQKYPNTVCLVIS